MNLFLLYMYTQCAPDPGTRAYTATLLGAGVRLINRQTMELSPNVKGLEAVRRKQMIPELLHIELTRF